MPRSASTLALLVLLCSTAAAACGQGGAGGAGSSAGSASAADSPCDSDSDCVLADTTCGNCSCPTHPLTKAGLAAHDERCRDRHVRCVVPHCPPPSTRAACVSNRCVAVPLTPPATPAPLSAAPSETSCQTNADCTSVPKECCPCGVDDWVPANQASRAAVTARQHVDDCADCPQQDCPPFDRLCTNGHCELRER